jgi:hypothetical protein
VGGAEEGHHTAFFDPLEKHTLQVSTLLFLSILFHLLGKKVKISFISTFRSLTYFFSISFFSRSGCGECVAARPRAA